MPTTFHHSLTPHFHTMARTGWRGGKNLMYRWRANPTTYQPSQAAVGTSDSGSISENADSHTVGADAGGPYCDFITGTGTDDCYIGTSGRYYTVIGLSDFYHIARFALPVAFDGSFFVGLTPYGNRTVINNSANPYSNMIGLRYIDGTDTNFQFVRSAASSVTSTDTSVAPATDVIYQLEQEFSSDGTSLRGRLTNVGTGSVLWADTTVTDNLPAVTTEMSPLIAAKNGTNTFRFYKHEVWI